MFIVFNKEKIYSYIVAFSTVIVLFVMAIYLSTNGEKTLQTSVGISKQLPIYSVETEEKKLALTINCAWAWSQMSEIDK